MKINLLLYPAFMTAMAVAVFAVTPASASKAAKLELADLPSRAEAIVLAKVVEVRKQPAQPSSTAQEVTIKTAAVLKGSVKGTDIKLVLQTSGVEDFDPELKVGDMGVFFLREVAGAQAKPAYWGSVAIFPKANFKVSGRSKDMVEESTKVRLETTMGDMVVELNAAAAPITVKNFLGYVEKGFYDGVIFHRVIPNFMIQTGGFTADMARKATNKPIVNEAGNSLKNARGTIAMARTSNPNSATSQFFINHKDNHFLDYVESRNPGYAVFGKVIEGMEVVDAIAAVKTTKRNGMADVPTEPVVIKSATVPRR